MTDTAEQERTALNLPANRLPRCGKLEPGNRQQKRRIALRVKTSNPIVCCRCGQKLLGWQHPIFDDGKDAHAACSLDRNRELKQMQRLMAYQDHLEKGTTAPCLPMTTIPTMTPLFPLSPIRQMGS